MMVKLDFKVQGLDSVKTLIELLHQYKDDLPEELNDKLIELSDCDVFEYGVDKIKSSGFNLDGLKVYVNGDISKGVVSANKLLKRIKVYSNFYDGDDRPDNDENGFVIEDFYPDTFLIEDKVGNKIIGWG